MRVGLLTDMYRPTISGVVNFLVAYKRALEEMGEEPYVLTFGDYPDDEERVIRSPSIPLKKDVGVYLGLDLGSSAKQVCETMDVLHVHHPFLSGQLALHYGKKWGIPVVFTSHTRYERYAHYVPLVPESLTRAVLDAYMPWFFNQCDLVIAPSMSTYRTLSEYGVETRLEVVPNGIDLDLFNRPRTEFSKQGLEIPPEDLVLIYTGRMAKEKNVDFLLEAYALALTEVPNLYLLLLGSGPEHEALEEMSEELRIQSRLRFMGDVPYEHVPGYLMVADLFVMPSGGEVHPLSIIEALAAGLPVVGALVPGVKDVIVDGVNGRLTHHTVSSFSRAIISLARDPEALVRMGREAEKEGRRNSIGRTASRMVQLYRELAGAEENVSA
jgi:1,2-diacylglycerol 3-alpha-glucosyltransferase